jgi:glyoxylase-like metal-dependent hydrolase (beta-lactamase superfamily II)
VSRTGAEEEMVAGFRVVATPGHSLGHTSLLSDEHGLLLTADAFGAMARRSADKLFEEEYATVAFSHGTVLRDAAKDRLRQIVAACCY